MTDALKTGDRIWYRQTTNSFGGFRDVSAIVRSMTKRRITIQIDLEDGTKQTLSVRPYKVRAHKGSSEA